MKITSRLVHGCTALLVLLAYSCTDRTQEGAPARFIAARLLEDYPDKSISKLELGSSDTEKRWVFAKGLQGWKLTGAEAQRAPNKGLHLLPTDAAVNLSIAFDPPRVFDVVKGDLGEGYWGYVAVFWAGPGQSFSAERRARIAPRDVKSGKFLAPVGSGLEGGDPIARLRVKLTPRSSESSGNARTINVRRLEVRKWKLDPERVASEGLSPQFAEAGHDLRPARFGLPGHPIEWPVALPSEAQLELATAVLSAPGQRVRFRVEILKETSRPKALFTRDVGLDDQDRWIDATIDLHSYAGTDVVLRFLVETGGGENQSPVAALWGNPVITGDREPGGEPIPDVILISLDTLRSDHLSLYGYRRPTSPNLDLWAAEKAVIFRNTIATAPWTLPSHASMLTGLGPLRHGVNHDQTAPLELQTLAESLRSQGYRTVAVTGGGFLAPKFGLSQGFDRYVYWPKADKNRELETGLAEVERALENHEGVPLFLFFHTYEIHAPYGRREPFFTDLAGPEGGPPPGARVVSSRQGPHSNEDLRFDSRFLRQDADGEPEEEAQPQDLGLVRLRYDASIAFTDRHLGRLLERLETRRASTPSLVMITSDHGEALGEKGLASHCYLYDFNLKVPLVIAFPERQWPGRQVEEQVSLVDVVPTVLDVLGLSGEDLDGASLLPLLQGTSSRESREAISYAASHNRGVSLRIDNRIKLVHNNSAYSGARGQMEIYDLETDPDESADLHPVSKGPHATEAGIMRRRIRDLLEKRNGMLNIRLENTGASPISGELKGKAVNVDHVKSDDLSCDCVEWQGKSTAAFQVPPATSYTLQLEVFLPRELELGTGSCPEATVVFKPEDIQERQTHQLPDRCPPESPRGRLAVEIWWQGASPRTGAATDLSPALADQLRALGYAD